MRVPGAAQREPEASGALQTRDRYAHHLREGPGTAAHRFATLALHRIRDTKCAYLSAYGVKPAHDDV